MGAPSWDYLVVTASNGRQAAAYDDELALRIRLGFLPGVRKAMAVPDPGGSRIGSGGSTVWSLLKVLERELGSDGGGALDPRVWIEALAKLRILIIHAGGDSRRLPAYSPCGKIFIPVPGASDRAPGPTILDRLLPVYLGLPPVREGHGQVVVTTGDVLLSFDPGAVRFADEGITGLGSLEPPELAANHGVFRAGEDGRVRSFLQKPSPAEQAAKGAVGSKGLSVLDIGVMNLDAISAVALIRLFCVRRDTSGGFSWEGEMAAAVERSGLDFYREICCAMGTDASFEDYPAAVRRAGSTLGTGPLKRIFDRVSRIPFRLSLLPDCGFLHFGTPCQLIRSGSALMSGASAGSMKGSLLAMNNEVSGNGRIRGRNSWVEGCRVRSALDLGGENAVTGADIMTPLSLPPKAALDVLEGCDRKGRKVHFVRCYAVDDILNKPADAGALLAGLAPGRWLEVLGASEADVWDAGTPREEKHVWTGRFFPATKDPEGFRDWLWMLRPKTVTPEQKKAWKAADRYSFSEMAGLASHDGFHSRRHRNRALEITQGGGSVFRPESGFSAAELSFVLANLSGEERRSWVSGVLGEAFRRFGEKKPVAGLGRLELARVLHALGSAVSKRMAGGDRSWTRTLAEIFGKMPDAVRAWLAFLGIGEREFGSAAAWAKAARNAAFETVGRTIVRSRARHPEHPRNALRSDEIVWGRAPVRLDLGGGWTDTPPYSLERGGRVINAAANLNGQPPIHVYARVIREPEIRIGSIDYGARIVVCDLAALHDYRRPESTFGLAKAALALSGFSPEAAVWPRGVKTLRDMLGLFGGGIELATLAAIPSGSGLGTSSILGAALLAVIHRMIGRNLSSRELFHNVLRLEQELTTGGGWQDQIGGVVGGVKVIEAEAGLVPDPRVRPVLPDVLDPARNGGTTLLYYTGIRRLAKNILRTVVGNTLDRDRETMATLAELRAFPPKMAEAMSAKDARTFGELIDTAWNLNKRLDPDSTTEVIEEILAKVRPHIRGAKLLGAGGGGFLLMACPSAAAAAAVRRILTAEPPNDLARFFDYSISDEGLAVTVS